MRNMIKCGMRPVWLTNFGDGRDWGDGPENYIARLPDAYCDDPLLFVCHYNIYKKFGKTIDLSCVNDTDNAICNAWDDHCERIKTDKDYRDRWREKFNNDTYSVDLATLYMTIYKKGDKYSFLPEDGAEKCLELDIILANHDWAKTKELFIEKAFWAMSQLEWG